MYRYLQPLIDARKGDDQNPVFYTVTFDSTGGSSVPSQIVEEGGFVQEPQEMLRTGFGFYRWYREAEHITPWDFDTDTVTADIILYARWLQNTVVVTLDIQEIISGNFAFDPITVSRLGGGGIVTAVVRVNEADYDAGSIRWEIAGIGAYAGQTVSGTGAEFWINAADVRYNTLGSHILRLQVGQNGIIYRANINFTIID